MRLVLALVLTIAWPIGAQAATAFVQSASAFGNDATVTFGMAPSASNRVFVLTNMASEGQTITLTGWGGSYSTIAGPLDSATYTGRAYAFCLVPDGVDTAFVVTTSGTAQAITAAVEVSGSETDCSGSVYDSKGIIDTAAVTTHTLTAMTAAVGDFVFGFIKVGSGAEDFSTSGADGSVDAANADINTDQALGFYKVATGTSESVVFTSATSANGMIHGITIHASGGGGGGSAPTSRISLLGAGL